MNKPMMIIWGLLVFCLWGIIITIAYKHQDREYIHLTADLKEVAVSYLNKKNIDLKLNESYKIYMSDLEEADYLVSDEQVNKYCIDSIVVTKKLIKYSYEINKECKIEE